MALMIMDGILKLDLVGRPQLQVSSMHGHVGIRVLDSGDLRTINSLTIWVEKEHEAKVREAVSAFNAALFDDAQKEAAE
jgi:hypothetical protein